MKSSFFTVLCNLFAFNVKVKFKGLRESFLQPISDSELQATYVVRVIEIIILLIGLMSEKLGQTPQTVLIRGTIDMKLAELGRVIMFMGFCIVLCNKCVCVVFLVLCFIVLIRKTKGTTGL